MNKEKKNEFYYFSESTKPGFKTWESFLSELSLEEPLRTELLFNLKKYKVPTLIKPIKERYTFCGILTDEHDLLIGISKCSPKDVFRKDIGRGKAKGRALNYATSNLDVFSLYDDQTELYSTPIYKVFLNECYSLEEKLKNKELCICTEKSIQQIGPEEPLSLFRRIFKKLTS